MERWHISSSGKDKSVVDQPVDFFCDHQDMQGRCCNRHAVFIITYKDSEFPIYTCERCVYMYMEDDSDCRYL